jgi:hypothetical protein
MTDRPCEKLLLYSATTLRENGSDMLSQPDRKPWSYGTLKINNTFPDLQLGFVPVAMS